MFGVSRSEFEAFCRSIRDEIAQLRLAIERGTTTAIRADLDNLVGRVEGINGSMQRQFGRLYVERRGKQDTEEPLPGNSELDDLVEFQRQFGAKDN